MFEQIEGLIEKVCARIDEKYTGFHTIGPGDVDGEPSPRVCFHVGDPDDIESRLEGTGGMYYLDIGSEKSKLYSAGEELVAEYTDITKADLAD